MSIRLSRARRREASHRHDQTVSFPYVSTCSTRSQPGTSTAYPPGRGTTDDVLLHSPGPRQVARVLRRVQAGRGVYARGWRTPVRPELSDVRRSTWPMSIRQSGLTRPQTALRHALGLSSRGDAVARAQAKMRPRHLRTNANGRRCAIAPARILTVPNGVDYESFRPINPSVIRSSCSARHELCAQRGGRPLDGGGCGRRPRGVAGARLPTSAPTRHQKSADWRN
jgi:hypothetical protein